MGACVNFVLLWLSSLMITNHGMCGWHIVSCYFIPWAASSKLKTGNFKRQIRDPDDAHNRLKEVIQMSMAYQFQTTSWKSYFTSIWFGT